MFKPGLPSMARRLSRYAVRFFSRASVSTTCVVLSSLSVVCSTMFPCFSTWLSKFGKSSGTTRRTMAPEGGRGLLHSRDHARRNYFAANRPAELDNSVPILRQFAFRRNYCQFVPNRDKSSCFWRAPAVKAIPYAAPDGGAVIASIPIRPLALA